MPTVRVIARLPDYPGKLVRELRARGFGVETRVASGLDAQAADLEIRLEHCPPEDLPAMVSGASDHEAVCMLLESAPGADGVRVLRLFLIANDEQIQAHAYTPLPKSVVEMCTALLNKSVGQTAAANSSAQLEASSVVRTLLRNYAAAARSFCVTGATRVGGVLKLGKQISKPPIAVDKSKADDASELVPTMFNFSGPPVEENLADPVVMAPISVPENPLSSRARFAVLNWRSGLALTAAALIFAGAIHFTVRHREGSLSAAGGNEAVVEKAPNIPAETASAQNEISDDPQIVKLKPATTRTSKDSASWRTRSGGWEVRQFGDDVTVRRLKESTPIQSPENPKVRVVEN